MGDRRRCALRIVASALVAALATTAASRSASAQHADTGSSREDLARRSAARAHFDRGVALAQRARWAEAAREFDAARALAPTPAVYFNLALAERGAGRPRAGLLAASAYREALGATADRAEIEQADALIERLRGELARLVPVLDPAGAALRVDGASVVPDARGVELDPGRHVVEASAPGYRAERRTLFVAAGARAGVEFHLVREERSAHLLVATNAPQATVRLDGHDVDIGRADEYVAPGRHQVELRAPGHPPVRREVTLALGETRVVRLDAEPATSAVVRSPWLWLGVAAVVVAGVATGVALGVANAPEPPARTAWGHVSDAVTVRW